MTAPTILHTQAYVNRDASRVYFSDGSIRDIDGMALLSAGYGPNSAVVYLWQEAPHLFREIRPAGRPDA